VRGIANYTLGRCGFGGLLLQGRQELSQIDLYFNPLLTHQGDGRTRRRTHATQILQLAPNAFGLGSNLSKITELAIRRSC